ncbi:tektin-4 [Phlebotomus argentipes]|uniref:tektin-4 n=1 Tax=Phlebotomus argentipes TaxID=94469 RepID=UPI00289370AC|nr:tektin-4 [Phlebotomus argentipes]
MAENAEILELPTKENVALLESSNRKSAGKSFLEGVKHNSSIVNQYSITRYTPNEWHRRNDELFALSHKVSQLSLKNDNEAKNCMASNFSRTNRTQQDNTERLGNRCHEIFTWQTNLEHAIQAQVDEIAILEEERHRLKKSMAILKIPESINSECLSRRCARPDSELIRDGPEEELLKETILINDIRRVLEKTLASIEQQQSANRAVKHKLEYHWSCKKEAYAIDSVNRNLENASGSTQFKPGATQSVADQSTEEFWNHFTQDVLDESEATRQKSIHLRGTLQEILVKATRDLRNQADTVEQMFQSRISCMDEVRTMLENNLRNILQKLADTETLISNLKDAIRNMDFPMKVSQTRLQNRNLYRPQVENCYDRSQVGLINEVGSLQKSVSDLKESLRQAEDTQKQLIDTRTDLEAEIMLKRRTINIDKDRCQHIRSYFPSATALSGYI